MTDENTSDTNAVSALRGMVSFFTLWHLDITQKDMDSMEQRFHMVPVVGILFGVILVIEALAMVPAMVARRAPGKV